VTLRRSIESEHGLFLAEGEKVVRRAVTAGYPVRSLLMAPRWVESLGDVLATTDAPCYVLDERLVEQVTGFHVHRGALASLHRTPLPSVDAVLQGARTVVVLEDIVDHTNVGAVLRTCAALGVDAVLLSPRCADPLYRRAVKVAMGAAFSVPWTRVPDWYDALVDLEQRGFPAGARAAPGRPAAGEAPGGRGGLAQRRRRGGHRALRGDAAVLGRLRRLASRRRRTGRPRRAACRVACGRGG